MPIRIATPENKKFPVRDYNILWDGFLFRKEIKEPEDTISPEIAITVKTFATLKYGKMILADLLEETVKIFGITEEQAAFHIIYQLSEINAIVSLGPNNTGNFGVQNVWVMKQMQDTPLLSMGSLVDYKMIIMDMSDENKFKWSVPYQTTD